MQERSGAAFVIATANNVEALPPELLRKGRFDEVWFVDLPTSAERASVLQVALASHGRIGIQGGTKGRIADIDLKAVAEVCDGFTGSEIAAIVPDAMFAAFGDEGREIETGDLLTAAQTVVPLSKTAAEKIAKLRDWAKGRARPATSAESTSDRTAARSRILDI